MPFYTDYEELLEKEHPDVVHLCLPHYLHVPVSEYFASHGVNVFCEKPVGLNTAQAKEFVEFEAAHPEVKIGICLQNRLNRTTVELKKIIDGGEYGKVIGCRGFVPWFRGKAYYDEQPWRGQLKTAGGGCMINQSVHTLDLLYYLCGAIDAIHGSVNQLADYGIDRIIFSSILYLQPAFSGNSPQPSTFSYKIKNIIFAFSEPVFPTFVPAFYQYLVESMLRSAYSHRNKLPVRPETVLL